MAFEHLACALEAVFRLFLEGLEDEGGDGCGNLNRKRVGRGRHGVDLLDEHAHGGVGLEGVSSGEHLVEDEAEGVEVGAAVDRALEVSAGLLGRHVLRCADDEVGLGQDGGHAGD